MLGSMITAAFLRYSGQTRRGALMTTFFCQGVSILIVALLISLDKIPQEDQESTRILIGVPLLAWQFGAQVAASRALGYSEIPTTVLTSVYNDLASDPNLWAFGNPKRDRRAIAVVMVLVGGICGGLLVRRVDGGFGIALWIGGGIKILLAFAWLGFPNAVA